MKMTIKQFAEANGVNYATARGGIDLLIVKGVVKKTDEQMPPAGGKGRGSNLFEVPDTVTVQLQC